MVCLYNSSVFLAGIHTDMMLIYFNLCRNETVTFGNRIWKLLSDTPMPDLSDLAPEMEGE